MFFIIEMSWGYKPTWSEFAVENYRFRLWLLGSTWRDPPNKPVFCVDSDCFKPCFSPPARWGLLDFMSAAFRFRSSCLPLLPSAPPAFRLACLLLVLLVQLRSAIHIVRCRTSTTTIHAQRSLPDLNHDRPRPVFPAGPQPRASTPSVPCRTSTTTIPAQCSLPDLNREYPRQVFPAGPQPRASTPSVPCRTSTATSRSQWALPTPNGKNVRKDVR